jgi:hypothetical protein
MKLAELIKMYLNENCSKVHVGKCLSYIFLIQNGQKKRRYFIDIVFLLCFVCLYEGVGKPGGMETEWVISADDDQMMK